MSGSSGKGAGSPTTGDVRACMAVWIVSLGITGVSLGALPGAIAGVGGGVIAGAVLCTVGAAEMARRARESVDELIRSLDSFGDGDAGKVGAEFTQRLGDARGTAVTRIRDEFSLQPPEAGRVFDQAIAWMRDNPVQVGKMYLALPKQTSDNILPLRTPRTSDITAAATSLAGGQASRA